ncbi:cysteine desulfurase SufS [Oxobacter pfennigii]|uniref:Cysteine desulfurase SufS n=1 Tax=Oxobacter pfennigii TaxID=36849 RepID=A0A0P8WBR7_9CLOT|nr:aminotransferase class V-fold PLP-dependent enzyme [Oxobacter pfennigii]KPU46091.1 cysteine desulfurase SufS [Oxobacter pfennigii]
MYFGNLDKGYRSLIMGADTKVPIENGRFVTAINFDNAATTPPFVSVINEVNKFAPWYSSVHRGSGYKSRLSSDLFESARLRVLNFVNADPEKYTAIFVKNTTEALNKLSYCFYNNHKDCVILSSYMEHHSNDLPWRDKFKVEYIDITEEGRLQVSDLEKRLIKHKGKVKLVTITGASNVTGYKNPIHEIAALSHKYGAQICVDGAQLIPHSSIDMMPHTPLENIDFLAFSAHKMYAPFGTGVLIGPKDMFERGDPDYKGGGTVKIVTKDFVIWDEAPYREEAGSPNIIGVVALLAAINTLEAVSMENIESYEQELTGYAAEKIRHIPDITVYGDSYSKDDKVGIISFNIKGLHHEIVAEALSREVGIAVRNGCFCAQPYIQKILNLTSGDIKNIIDNAYFPRPGMVRISFGLYNSFEEIDKAINALQWITAHRYRYTEKYASFRRSR